VWDFVKQRLPANVKPVISLMGLAFKGQPDTDDLRGSTALLMIKTIQKDLPTAELRGQDYVVSNEEIAKLGIKPVDEAKAFEGAHAVLVMNNNRKYFTLDIEARAVSMARPGLIYDAWNIFSHNIDLPEGVSLYVLGK